MPGDDDPTAPLALLLRSYEEVLDATKHQDDKVGRFLAGIAFLTTGAIAFAVGLDALSVRYDLGGDRVALPAWLFLSFLVLVLFSVLFLVVSLGPNLLSRPGRSRPASRLFFLEIARQEPAAWRARWQADVATEVDEVRATLPDEIHNLATKTAFKYRSTNVARVLAQTAFALLAAAMALTVLAQAGHDDWWWAPRLLTAALLGGATLVFALDWFEVERDRWPGRPPWARRALVAVCPLAVFWAAFGPVVAVVAGAAAGALAAAWYGWGRWWAGAVPLAWAVALAVAVVQRATAWQLALACVGVVLVQVPRLLRSFAR